MRRVDGPAAAWGFRHPLNFAALLRGHITFFGHDDGDFVTAAKVGARRPLSPEVLRHARMGSIVATGAKPYDLGRDRDSRQCQLTACPMASCAEANAPGASGRGGRV